MLANETRTNRERTAVDLSPVQKQEAGFQHGAPDGMLVSSESPPEGTPTRLDESFLYVAAPGSCWPGFDLEDEGLRNDEHLNVLESSDLSSSLLIAAAADELAYTQSQGHGMLDSPIDENGFLSTSSAIVIQSRARSYAARNAVRKELAARTRRRTCAAWTIRHALRRYIRVTLAKDGSRTALRRRLITAHTAMHELRASLHKKEKALERALEQHVGSHQKQCEPFAGNIKKVGETRHLTLHHLRARHQQALQCGMLLAIDHAGGRHFPVISSTRTAPPRMQCRSSITAEAMAKWELDRLRARCYRLEETASRMQLELCHALLAQANRCC